MISIWYTEFKMAQYIEQNDIWEEFYMMVRKLTEEDYLFMMQWLDETEPKDPMEAFYTVGMTVDESDYFLKILPDR